MQTLIRSHFLRRRIWAYIVCLDMSVQTLRLSTAIWSNRPPPLRKFEPPSKELWIRHCTIIWSHFKIQYECVSLTFTFQQFSLIIYVFYLLNFTTMILSETYCFPGNSFYLSPLQFILEHTTRSKSLQRMFVLEKAYNYWILLGCIRVLTLSTLQTKTYTFANSVDPDETAHTEPSH